MARITKFQRGQMDRFQLHDEVDAKIFFHEYDGRKLLQISTYGRNSRQEVGKLSQAIQLDELAAMELFSMLKKEFGFN
ncbi:methionyl-tRNA formyltransferase [Rhizobium sp. TRM96647]|uniref:methionyl-tRNA formyltransferase n=1 Tax=unclassified Rhizobium TaxID=2613769 RepID=UPI0021E96BD8|nr:MULTISPECIES: methionyl-tRNA formyltransferase [unclassified Rhizobium]MCV3738238.1 methionyl-tRNA formyltransferase [Rhizobium sp. TRM96647]MCV3760013.1 methionyl-tRNA formyltransferase [Rhizobium sp. TRM96650]